MSKTPVIKLTIPAIAGISLCVILLLVSSYTSSLTFMQGTDSKDSWTFRIQGEVSTDSIATNDTQDDPADVPKFAIHYGVAILDGVSLQKGNFSEHQVDPHKEQNGQTKNITATQSSGSTAPSDIPNSNENVTTDWLSYQSPKLSTTPSPESTVSPEATKAKLEKWLPFQNPNLPWHERVDDLVGRLTPEEVVSLSKAWLSPAIPRLGIKPYVWNSECVTGQQTTNNTNFPQSIGLAATFSEELLYNMSEAISFEVRAQWNANKAREKYVYHIGLSCFSPVVNIMRHPLWGRNQETYGEDPYLSGKLAQNFIRGLQGNDPRYVRVSAGCKHFDVHGGPENIPTSRFSFDAKVSMRDMRMTYLPQFKMCVEAGTHSLMCSYNRINGVPACANKQLLTDITRNEWGFKGYVVSDEGAVSGIVQSHKYMTSMVDTVAAVIKAGCNMELALGKDAKFDDQLAALKQGKLSEADIRNNIRPLIYTRMRLGEFDPPDMVPYNKISTNEIQNPKHRELAITAATMSFVLLKNYKGLLPLKGTVKKVAIVGPMANNKDKQFGDYTSDIHPRYTTSVYEGLSGLGRRATLAPGCPTNNCDSYDSKAVKRAVKGADLIVVALGTGNHIEGEVRDRWKITLPGTQGQLLKDAVQGGKGAPVILLVFNAGPLDINWAKRNNGVTAIMACFFPGQSTGEALYRSLTMSEATAAPAGRLPATWPTFLYQVPLISNYSMDGHTYRYYHGDPLYPFGYGLSYTTFEYTGLSVVPDTMGQGQDLKVNVDLRNTGKLSSYEVVQVYVSWPRDTRNIPVPKLQLVGFARPFIEAGGSTTVVFTVKAEQYAVWIDDTTGFGFIPGRMKLYAGGQQPGQKTTVGSNVLDTSFIVKG